MSQMLPNANQGQKPIGVIKGSNSRATLVAGRKRTALLNAETDYQMILAATGLERSEIEKIKIFFDKFDLGEKGFIMKYEVDDVLKNMEYTVKDDELKKFINQETEDRKTHTVDFNLTCEIYSRLKKKIIDDEEEAQNFEYIDAFAALGGNFDRTGFIQKEIIIQTIKNEFGLLFEVEKLFENAHITSENISFQEFCTMFENNEDSKSIISAVSNQFRATQLTAGFQVKFSDFEQWNQTF